MPRFTIQGRTFNAPSLEAATEAFEQSQSPPEPEYGGLDPTPTAANWQQAARDPRTRWIFPLMGAVAGPAIAPGAGTLKGALVGGAMTGGAEAGRQAIAGEPFSGLRVGGGAVLGGAPGPFVKHAAGPALGRGIRMGARLFPGAAAALQERAVGIARGAVEAFPEGITPEAVEALKSSFRQGASNLAQRVVSAFPKQVAPRGVAPEVVEALK